MMLVSFAAVTLLTSSCNTFIGLGRDMRLAGEGMEKTANKATGSGSGGGGGGDYDGGAPIY